MTDLIIFGKCLCLLMLKLHVCAMLSFKCVKVCKNYANSQTVPYKEAYVAVDEVDQYDFLDNISISIKEKRELLQGGLSVKM